MSGLRYYVYELVDPRYDLGFYIGKGTGNRWRQHMHQRKRKHRPNPGNFLKAGIIQSIREAGLDVQCRKLGLFSNEDAAYAFEADLLAEARKDGRVLANYNDGICAEKPGRRPA